MAKKKDKSDARSISEDVSSGARDDAPAPKELEREDELFIQEINEQMKAEKYADIWKKYGRYFVGIAVVAIGAVAGWQYLKSQGIKEQAAAGLQFASAIRLSEAGKTADAAKIFDKVARETEGGYAMLSRLRQAAAVAKAGNAKEAAKLYQALSEDPEATPTFRELGTVLWALTALDFADASAMSNRLQPLMADGKPWRHTATELAALYSEKAGKRSEAVKLFTKLSKDTTAPATLRARAREMLTILAKS